MPANGKFNKANFSYFFSVSFASLLSIFVFLMAAFSSNLPLTTNLQQKPAILLQTTQPPVTKKVLVLDFNPVLTTQSNQKLTDYRGWDNPKLLEASYIEDIRNNSGSYVDYQIVEHKEINAFPTKTDGFAYSEAGYLDCLNNNTCHNPDTLNYQKILSDYDVCGKRNRGEIDELWLWGGPHFGYFEAALAGPNAFWYTSDPIGNTECNKLLPIMGFNYQSNTALMLTNLIKRVEAAMVHVYGTWEHGKDNNPWNRFTLVDRDLPEQAVCGYSHYAPNSDSEYQWDNHRNVDSSCANWFNYPQLSADKQSINCDTWGCDNYGFNKWWLNHLPRYEGSSNGKLNNWWRYVLEYEESVSTTTGKRCDLPAVPTSIQAVSGPDASQVKLTWNAADRASYYSITYGPSSLNYQWGAANIGNVTSYVVSQLNAGAPYYFIVRAHNDCGSSGALQEVAAYAGEKAKQQTYWKAPEVVYLPPDKLPSAASESAAPSVAPSATPSASQPSPAPKSFLSSLPQIQLPKIGNTVKWVAIILAGLIILALIGKRIIEREEEIGPPPSIPPETPPQDTWPPEPSYPVSPTPEQSTEIPLSEVPPPFVNKQPPESSSIEPTPISGRENKDPLSGSK
jgi:hypothetical protein